MKIRFESDYDLPVSKILNIPVYYVIIVRFDFQENNYIHKFFYMSAFTNINMT